MSADHPGALRRTALRVFKRLPAGPSQQIVRFVSPTWTIGAIALIEYDERILALRQTHRKGLSLPGGLLDHGEIPADAVAREVQEETGLRIDPGDVSATVFDARMKHCDVIFRVRCDHEPQVRVASEATSYSWVRLADWPTERDTPTERILDAVRASREPSRLGTLLG